MEHLVIKKASQDPDLARRLEYIETQICELQAQSESTRHSARASLQELSSFDAFNARFRAFEQTLATSRVYKRVEHRSEVMSFSTSIPRHSVLSSLTKCSLGDVSVLSVVALPVCIPKLSPNQSPNLDLFPSEANQDERKRRSFTGRLTWRGSRSSAGSTASTASPVYPSMAWLYDPKMTPPESIEERSIP